MSMTRYDQAYLNFNTIFVSSRGFWMLNISKKFDHRHESIPILEHIQIRLRSPKIQE
jgi:hypothetical protein